jgi:hypothetical protein
MPESSITLFREMIYKERLFSFSACNVNKSVGRYGEE